MAWFRCWGCSCSNAHHPSPAPATIMILRPYQLAAKEALRQGILSHRFDVDGKSIIDPGLLVAPTGSGKSEILAAIAKAALGHGYRVGVVVNRRILVRDLCKRMDRVGLTYGVIMGGEPRKAWEKLHVASFDTLWRREYLPKWDLVFVDECHFSLAEKYSQVIERLKANGAAIIGLTATPIRGSGQGLGSIYKWMVRCPDTPDLIDAGYLVRPRVFAPPGQADVRKVEKTAGDFNQKQLAAVCDNTKLTGDILTHWLKNGRGNPTIGFGVDIAHCQHMAEMFCGAGIRAVAVDHRYKGDFDLVWNKLANYETEVVFNVGIAGYGWDCPPVSRMIEARPTQSLGLWLQHCGRIMRMSPGKTEAVINDHAGNAHRHGLPDEYRDWQLDGDAVRVPDGEKIPSIAQCKHSYKWPDFRNEPPKIINGVQMPCYSLFRAGPRECPRCGIPLKITARKIEVEAGELTEIKRPGSQQERIEAAKIAAAQKSDYFELLGVARNKGMKDGWAYHRFCEKYGFAPPKEWIPAAREFQEAMQ